MRFPTRATALHKLLPTSHAATSRLVQALLNARYAGHWYPEEPHRGCAYRAVLSTVNQIDPLLLRAAEKTGQRGLFESFNRVFADVGEVNCWVRSTSPPLPLAFAPQLHPADRLHGRMRGRSTRAKSS